MEANVKRNVDAVQVLIPIVKLQLALVKSVTLDGEEITALNLT